MEKTEIPEELYVDEAVHFIAERHKTTPRELLRDFLGMDSSKSVSCSVDRIRCLEANELEILRGLIRVYNKD